MARASTPTLLSLDRYARLMGIPPAPFNSAYGTGTTGIVFPVPGCSTVWYQHPWQNNDQLSREELAETIRQAESDLAEALGYWPGPVWIEQEVHKHPGYFRPDAIRTGNIDSRGQVVGLRANYGKIIGPGRRAVTLVANSVAVVYTDADGDGYAETATISGATTVTDARELKFFFTDNTDAEEEWEIRPARSCSITAAGIYTARFWTWQLIDPALWEALPRDDGNIAAIEAVAPNVETIVDVYRVYNDTTATSATFYWEPDPRVALGCSVCGGAGCEVCTLTTQDGCLHVRNPMLGEVVPQPGTYANSEWGGNAYSVCRDPDMVKIWYYCGELSQDWLKEKNAVEPLSDRWARAIAYMATARLERPICNCGNAMGLFTDLRLDLAYTKDGPHQVSFETLENPFGTRKGEVYAWRMIRSNARDKVAYGGAVG